MLDLYPGVALCEFFISTHRDTACLLPLNYNMYPPCCVCDLIFSNAEVIYGWRSRGKDKKKAANFGYTTLLPDNIPQSINI